MARGSLGLVPGALNLSLFMALSLLLLLLAPGPARAQATSTQGAGAASPTIYSPPAGSKFKYSGCFNETTDLPGTARERALDGSHRVSPGSMTVQACIDFCDGGDKPYKYAGLEFSRECWCGNRLSVLATKFDDSECNTACDGDQKSVCGGPMKLSVYVNGASRSAAGVSVVVAIAVGVATTMRMLI
ncbi:hypothetical protein RB595_000933 [Gaeumannomyces hyphopodioides]